MQKELSRAEQMEIWRKEKEAEHLENITNLNKSINEQAIQLLPAKEILENFLKQLEDKNIQNSKSGSPQERYKIREIYQKLYQSIECIEKLQDFALSKDIELS